MMMMMIAVVVVDHGELFASSDHAHTEVSLYNIYNELL